jgi:S1-C subfamily serine protease
MSLRTSALRRSVSWLPLLALLGVVSAWLVTLEPEAARGDDPFLRRTPTVRAVERVGPSVVNITTETIVTHSPFRSGSPFIDPFFRDFFEPRQRRKTLQNLGSGLLIDAKGHVLTNEHVISRASRVRVSLSDGREFDATLVGADPKNDLAVILIQADEPLPWTDPGTSSDLLVGEPVIAIGNPFGLSNTVTTGVISALNRSFRTDDRTFHGFLQTDASINPGNSGGPLLNAEGSVIGINSAIYGGAQGIGFAIPISTANRVVAELIAYGEVLPPWVGFSFQTVDDALHDVLELPSDVNGVLVNEIWDEGPADRSGLERGDIITRIDGRPLHTAYGLYEMLEPTTTGQKLRIEVWRDSKTFDSTIQVEELPHAVASRMAERRLGMKLSLRSGGGYEVRSVRANTGASQTGIQAGDLILVINGRVLEDADDFRRAAHELGGRPQAAVVVARAGNRYHVTIPLQ